MNLLEANNEAENRPVSQSAFAGLADSCLAMSVLEDGKGNTTVPEFSLKTTTTSGNRFLYNRKGICLC